MTQNTRTPTEREAALYRMRPVAERFPITFKNGTRWTGIITRCGGCDRQHDDAGVRGELIEAVHDSVVVEAIGECPTCKIVTPIKVLLCADGTLTNLLNGADGSSALDLDTVDGELPVLAATDWFIFFCSLLGVAVVALCLLDLTHLATFTWSFHFGANR